MKLLIANSLSKAHVSLLEQHPSLTVLSRPKLTPDEFSQTMSQFNPHILVVRSRRVTSQHIESATNLKLIIRAGSGFNTIDFKFAGEKNVKVCNVPGKNSNAVCELVFAHLLNIDRKIA